MDEIQLLTALTAGAAIAGAELVKETTKDAYRGLKNAAATIFGNRAVRAIEKVEKAPSDPAVRQSLKEALPSIDGEDADELRQKVVTLLEALRHDAHAVQIVDTVARIKLDVDAGGNITLADIRGVRDIDVKAKAGGDFTLHSIEMDPGKQRGNV